MRYLVIIFFFINVLHFTIGNLCKVCECLRSDDLIVYNCDGKLENRDDLDLFMFIDQDPPNELILSNNGVDEMLLEKIKYLRDLRLLDLSHNNISNIDATFFENLSKLQSLDLSWNNLKSFNIEEFAKLKLLSELDLSNNQIEIINGSDSLRHLNVIDLNLSGNLLEEIPTDFFQYLPNLNSLDLSHNFFHSFNSTSDTVSFHALNLEHNLLDSIFIDFPYLNALRVGYNELTSLPRNLSVQILSIENNNISEIIYDELLFNQLTSLNVSGNALSTMPNLTIPNLELLDISYNQFIEIPWELTIDNLPKLDTLIISGNPIKEVKLFSDLQLRNLIVKNTSLLNTIYEDAFEKLKGHEGECVNLTISSNKNLKSFNEESLRDLNICYLDLSDNGFTRISKKLNSLWNGSLPEYGVNLQGNPFICDCKSEWILEELIPKFYALNPELLNDLRCAKPEHLANKRMVHWYKWKGEVFCDENLTENDFSRLEVFDGRENFIKSRKEIALKSSTSMLIIVITAVSSLLLLVVVGMVISYRFALKKRRLNRRF